MGGIGGSGILGGEDADTGRAFFVVGVHPFGAVSGLDDLEGGVGIGVYGGVSGWFVPGGGDLFDLLLGKDDSGHSGRSVLAEDEEGGDHKVVN